MKQPKKEKKELDDEDKAFQEKQRAGMIAPYTLAYMYHADLI